jgi:DNA-binding SARP family transcriptional activator
VGDLCSIQLLGSFAVSVNGTAIPDSEWRHRRAAQLVKILALAPAHRMHREQLMALLWPEFADEAGGANLRKALFHTRKAMRFEGAVRNQSDMVALWPDGVLLVDVERFEEAAVAAVRSADPDLAASSASLYGGELLPEDRFEPWAEDARRALRARHLEVLKLAGRWADAVAADPLDEEAARALMRTELDAGNRQAAIRLFDRLRTGLRDEFGVAPAQETLSLYEQVISSDGEEPPTSAERAGAMLAQGLVAWNRGDLPEAQRSAEAARRVAVEAELGHELGQASALLGMVAHARGRWRELFRTEFAETLRLTPALAEFVVDAHLCLAEFSLYGPDASREAGPFARDLLELAEREESLVGQGLATLMLGEAALLTGLLDGANRLLTTASELNASAGVETGRIMAQERIAESLIARGSLAQARTVLRPLSPAARDSSLATHLVVRVRGAMVQAADPPARAADAVRDAQRAMDGMDVCEPCSMGYLVSAATALAAAGELEEARTYMDRAERIAGMWQGGSWIASVWEARGALREAEGQPDQAAALYREAAERFDAEGRPLDRARCLARAGED